MAAADYRKCDVCGGKAFYDAELNYDQGQKIGDKWVYPETPFRIAGEDQAFGDALGHLGDWAVLCKACAITHKTIIVPVEPIV